LDDVQVRVVPKTGQGKEKYHSNFSVLEVRGTETSLQKLV